MRLLHFCVLLLCCSVAYAENALFVSEQGDRAAQVELFEFESLEQQRRAAKLAKSLRCPQCQNQNLVESNSPMAQDLRLVVYKKVLAGDSDQQIVTFMTERYGQFVRYNPAFTSQTWLLWLLPLFLVLLVVAVLVILVKKDLKLHKK